jgi:hypothetical protein
MKASFDGARMNLLRDFNDLAKTEFNNEQKEIMKNLRSDVVALLCMYDDYDAEDCNCLIDEVTIVEIIE